MLGKRWLRGGARGGALFACAAGLACGGGGAGGGDLGGAPGRRPPERPPEPARADRGAGTPGAMGSPPLRRRTLLRATVVGAAAAGAWVGWEGLIRATGAPGAARRFTGSGLP